MADSEFIRACHFKHFEIISLKKLILKVHLYLGLLSGLVVVIVSLTGCLYVFQEEICLLFQTGVFRNIEPQEAELISPLELKEIVENSFDKQISYMNATVYTKGDRAAIVWARDMNRKYTSFIVNPYSGEIIESQPYRLTFWSIVLAIHTSLLIPQIGHHIVSISTIIFIVMMITGLYLWFPKSKNGYKQRFKVKWGASFKRLNYDLHNVLGFYITWLAIIIAITGLIMSYSWMDKAVYWVASGGRKPIEREQVISIIPSFSTNDSDSVEKSLLELLQKNENISNYLIEYPRDSISCYTLTLNSKKGEMYNRNDTYYVDQYCGAVLDDNLWENKNNGDRLQATNYNLHVGAILDLPGKILAFFVSLVATSLPITGFMIWRGRKKKKNLRRRSNVTKMN